jgi:hypothetical protein
MNRSLRSVCLALVGVLTVVGVYKVAEFNVDERRSREVWRWKLLVLATLSKHDREAILGPSRADATITGGERYHLSVTFGDRWNVRYEPRDAGGFDVFVDGKPLTATRADGAEY